MSVRCCQRLQRSLLCSSSVHQLGCIPVVILLNILPLLQAPCVTVYLSTIHRNLWEDRHAPFIFAAHDCLRLGRAAAQWVAAPPRLQDDTLKTSTLATELRNPRNYRRHYCALASLYLLQTWWLCMAQLLVTQDCGTRLQYKLPMYFFRGPRYYQSEYIHEYSSCTSNMLV